MYKLFNKKIESKFIDNLLVKFYLFVLFLLPSILLFWLLINYPYKEVLICNSSKCRIEQHFLFSNSNNVSNIKRPINVKVYGGGPSRLRSYSLILSEYNSLFHSSYYIPYFAYKDKKLIESNSEKIKITKYNQDMSLPIIFNIVIAILIIFGRINYLKNRKNKINF